MALSPESTPKRRPNGQHAKQINEMQQLTPRAAAWLAGVPVSTLRDAAATLPPASDGTYCAQTVSNWANARMLSTVDDGDLETIHKAIDVYGWSQEPGPLARVINLMRSKYGRGADGWFLDALLFCGELSGTDVLDQLPRLTDEELLSRAREAYEAERNRRAELRLNFSCVCESCKRLRRGNRWVKGEPDADEVVIAAICNKCSTTAVHDPFKVRVTDLLG